VGVIFLALQFVSLLSFSSQFCMMVTEKVGVLKCCHIDHRRHYDCTYW